MFSITEPPTAMRHVVAVSSAQSGSSVTSIVMVAAAVLSAAPSFTVNWKLA